MKIAPALLVAVLFAPAAFAANLPASGSSEQLQTIPQQEETARTNSNSLANQLNTLLNNNKLANGVPAPATSTAAATPAAIAPPAAAPAAATPTAIAPPAAAPAAAAPAAIAPPAAAPAAVAPAAIAPAAPTAAASPATPTAAAPTAPTAPAPTTTLKPSPKPAPTSAPKPVVVTPVLGLKAATAAMKELRSIDRKIDRARLPHAVEKPLLAQLEAYSKLATPKAEIRPEALNAKIEKLDSDVDAAIEKAASNQKLPR